MNKRSIRPIIGRSYELMYVRSVTERGTDYDVRMFECMAHRGRGKYYFYSKWGGVDKLFNMFEFNKALQDAKDFKNYGQ